MIWVQIKSYYVVSWFLADNWSSHESSPMIQQTEFLWKLREKLQAFRFLYQPTTLRIIVAIFPWPRMFLGVHSYFPWWEEFTFWIIKTPSLESPRKMFSKRNSYIGDGTPSALQWNFTGCPCVTVFSGRLDVSLVALGLSAQKKNHRQSKKGLSNNLSVSYTHLTLPTKLEV